MYIYCSWSMKFNYISPWVYEVIILCVIHLGGFEGPDVFSFYSHTIYPLMLVGMPAWPLGYYLVSGLKLWYCITFISLV